MWEKNLPISWQRSHTWSRESKSFRVVRPDWSAQGRWSEQSNPPHRLGTSRLCRPLLRGASSSTPKDNRGPCSFKTSSISSPTSRSRSASSTWRSRSRCQSRSRSSTWKTWKESQSWRNSYQRKKQWLKNWANKRRLSRRPLMWRTLGKYHSLKTRSAFWLPRSRSWTKLSSKRTTRHKAGGARAWKTSPSFNSFNSNCGNGSKDTPS